MENGSPDDFPQSVYSLLIVQTKFIVCPFFDEETNGSHPYVSRLNGLRLSHLCQIVYHRYCITKV
jgi:hypothetical protein